MPLYPAPEENPFCWCRIHGWTGACDFGHEDECHYPMNCHDAACTVFLRDPRLTEEDRVIVEREVEAKIKAGLVWPYNDVSPDGEVILTDQKVLPRN